MRRLISLIALAVTATALAASTATSAPQSGAKVALGRSPLGRILVDARGRTLYLFEKDKRGRSSCSGACAAYWPPLLTNGKPVAANGVKASPLRRHDAGDLRRPSALPLRAGHEARPNTRSGSP
jgi:predicted lipoprotein with Yx(FWY)xxD motif